MIVPLTGTKKKAKLHSLHLYPAFFFLLRIYIIVEKSSSF
jgi:hypothetical protein